LNACCTGCSSSPFSDSTVVISAVGLRGEHEAGLDRLAVEQHRAHAADALLAADVGTGQAEVVAEEVDEQPPRLDLALHLLAVHGHVDADRLDRLGHLAPSLRRAWSSSIARRT
jgi:phage terminase large subunit-like protein